MHLELTLPFKLQIFSLYSFIFQDPKRNPTTKIPVSEGGKSASPMITATDVKSIAQAMKALRPSTLVYRSTPARTMADAKAKATGAIPKNTCVVTQNPADKVAPKATPEDLSTFTSTFSSSSSEDMNLETSMQKDKKSLNVTRSEEERALLRHLRRDPPGGGARIAPLTREILSQRDKADKAAFDASDAKYKEISMRNILLLKHLSDSERLDDSGSAFSRSSRESGVTSHTLHGGSGTISATGATAGSHLKNKESEVYFTSNPCLLPKSGSEHLSAAQSGSHDRLLDNEHATGGSNPGHSVLKPQSRDVNQCLACGLSPSSPTYFERHKKWCHTGAHALDVFMSPDDTPGSPTDMWRPVTATTSDGSPTAVGATSSYFPYHFPKVGAGTPRVPMQTTLGGMEGEFYYSDDEDQEDQEDHYCNRPLLPKGGAVSPPVMPRPLPLHTSTSASITGMKRTPSDKGERHSSRGSSRDRHKKYSTEGCLYGAMPGGMQEQTMRLEPVGAASSDSLSGESHCSRHGDGDGSTDKLQSENLSHVHEHDAGKDGMY